MTGRLLAGGALASLAAAAAGAPPQGFAPGLWTHQTDMITAEGTGYPQWMVKMAGSKSRKACYTAQQAANEPHVLLAQDEKAKCRTTRFVLAGGKLDYVAVCTNKRFPEPLTVASVGTYTPASYAMTSTATGMKKGTPVKIVTKATGKRIGDCG